MKKEFNKNDNVYMYMYDLFSCSEISVKEHLENYFDENSKNEITNELVKIMNLTFDNIFSAAYYKNKIYLKETEFLNNLDKLENLTKISKKTIKELYTDLFNYLNEQIEKIFLNNREFKNKYKTSKFKGVL